jgi:hypothetical protein
VEEYDRFRKVIRIQLTLLTNETGVLLADSHGILHSRNNYFVKCAR